MTLLAPLPNSSDEQVEWFHALAEAAATGKLDETAAGLFGHLSRFVELHLPGHEIPPATTHAELISTVALLRDSERSWNRALASALIHANERSEAGFPQEAVAELTDFAAQCPWKLFSQVAQRHAQRLGG